MLTSLALVPLLRYRRFCRLRRLRRLRRLFPPNLIALVHSQVRVE